MSLALWEFFWNASGNVWGATSAGAASSSIGGSKSHDNYYPRPDSEYWDVREKYLRSIFDKKQRKPKFRTPPNFIKSPPPPRTVGTPAPSTSVSPQFFSQPVPNVRPIQLDLSQIESNIARLNDQAKSLRTHQQPTLHNVNKPLSTSEVKRKVARRAALALAKALTRPYTQK